MTIPLSFDHLAICAPSLEAGVAHVQDALGVDIPFGGEHPRMGTHNHLMKLGDDEFLEVLAINPTAPKPKEPRWFAMDRWGDQAPRLANWIVRCDDIAAALEDGPSAAGRPVDLTRGDLKWQISAPDDGSLPFEAAFPTLIEWPMRPYPGAKMADRGCKMIGLTIEHPNGDLVARLLEGRLHDPRIQIKVGPEIRMVAEIETPNGIRRLT